MIKHTFIDKSTTIFKGYGQNFGLNPVAELNYGKMVSRALIHFDENELKKMYQEKELGDLSKVKHILKLTNCASQDSLPYEKELSDGLGGTKERASSFDIILFTLPKDFDAGRGFEFSNDFWVTNRKSVSTQGCNWFNSATHNPWGTPGIYSCDDLQKEIDKINDGEESNIIISYQHFDFGNEQFIFDITGWVNKVLKEEVGNHGLGLAFTPRYETSGDTKISEYNIIRPVIQVDKCLETSIVTDTTNIIKQSRTPDCTEQRYVGFFTNNTNTIFHPFLETIYENQIDDDRAQFYLGKENKLYFYSIIDGEYENLDKLPVCEIEGVQFDVHQSAKGVYFVSVAPESVQMDKYTIYYDTWSEIVYNGQEMDDVTLEFVALPYQKYFQFGAGMPMKDLLVPQVSGINDMEELPLGEKRRVIVDCRKKYTVDKKDISSRVDYRIWFSEGNREIDIIEYTPLEKTFMNNFFYLNTDDFIPGKYHVDFRVKSNGEIRQYKNKLTFIIKNNITQYYQ